MSTNVLVENNEENLKLVYFLTQETRVKIMRQLFEVGSPLYIKEIAKSIAETPRNTSFHLMTLAEKGLVSAELREVESIEDTTGNGRAAKFYTLTDQGKGLVSTLLKIRL